MFFADGHRRIDFILAWSIEPDKKLEEAKEARRVFETALEKEGLELEYDRVSCGSLIFCMKLFTLKLCARPFALVMSWDGRPISEQRRMLQHR